jgi:hypothetical protein
MRNLYERVMNHKYGGYVVVLVVFVILNILMLIER